MGEKREKKKTTDYTRGRIQQLVDSFTDMNTLRKRVKNVTDADSNHPFESVGEGSADTDGFIVVGKKKRAFDVQYSNPLDREVPSKKHKKTFESDFYRFQLRERKRAELAQIRLSDINDKAKVAEMKAFKNTTVKRTS